jgi:hypothetical protein
LVFITPAIMLANSIAVSVARRIRRSCAKSGRAEVMLRDAVQLARAIDLAPVQHLIGQAHE